MLITSLTINQSEFNEWLIRFPYTLIDDLVFEFMHFVPDKIVSVMGERFSQVEQVLNSEDEVCFTDHLLTTYKKNPQKKHRHGTRWCYFCRFFLYLSNVCLYNIVSSASCSLVITCWERMTSWLSYMWCFLVLLSLSHMISLVRCGT